MLKHSTLLLTNLQNWGMTSNGKCLTARITESPRTGKGSSLSEILEEHPDQKYFLSEKMTQRLLDRVEMDHRPPRLLTQHTTNATQTESTFVNSTTPPTPTTESTEMME